MKIQELALIFLIIILPISLVLSIYTQYQVQTINTQTLYDSKLSSATYDAIRAFQINTSENKQSDLANSKIRDLEASVSTFRNSIMSTFSLDGYSQDDLDRYIPALVYTLYDGFYIYSPYENVNYRYDDDGNPTDDNGENLYGLKPYISYSCRYVRGDIDVVITYALDNHITVQGMIGTDYVNKEGYLIDNIIINNSSTNEAGEVVSGDVQYNGVEITAEQTKEYIPLRNVSYEENVYSYIKLDGKTYYLDEDNNRIISRLNDNTLEVQYKAGDGVYDSASSFITNGNTLAKDYYIDAFNFTTWFKNSGLTALEYADAYDSVVADSGDINAYQQVWADNDTKIFQFLDTSSKNIENELSSFNQHRLAVIRHKIEVNLSIAIANYNIYSGAATNNIFQMPDLSEVEWDNITHNISLISFLQGLPIGGKIYNGYALVTNSESEEVVLEQNIYILGKDSSGKKEYYKIGDQNIAEINSGEYGDISEAYRSAGRLNLSFKRDQQSNGDVTYYYYPITTYNASYNSIIMQNNMDTYDDIYEYVNGKSNELKIAFYTALGRERAGKYKTWNDYLGDIIINGEIKNYTITYSDDGEQYAQTVVEKGSSHTIIDLPSKSGRVYINWLDTNTGITYTAGQEITNIQGDINFVAQYNNTYTITYYDGANILKQSVVQEGSSHTIEALPPSTSEREYRNWIYTSTNTTYNEGDIIENIQANINLSAQYKIKYTVTYNNISSSGLPTYAVEQETFTVNLGSLGGVPIEVTVGSTILTSSQYTLSGNTLTIPGGNVTGNILIRKKTAYTITNKVTNGSFESGLNSWNVIAAANTTPTWTATSSTKRTGTYRSIKGSNR